MAVLDGTKPSVQPKPFEPIVRERIVELFRAAANYRVTLVVAPAGYGKSVAVKHYLERDGKDHLRFAIRPEQATLLDVVTGLTSALSAFAPDAAHSVSEVYHRANSSDDISVLTRWLSTLLIDYDGTIVIEDLHRAADDPRSIELITDLVARSHERLNWIIASRDTLTLPIASWVAYGTMGLPIIHSDLELKPLEAEMIVEGLGIDFDAGALDEILRFTGAWPAAFAFALHVSARSSDVASITEGTREMVYGFLAQQVLNGLAQPERDFLFKTAMLPALHLDLVRLAGYPEPHNAIQKLRTRTGFIFSETDGVYRYHDLFRDFLEHRLIERGIASYRRSCERASSILSKGGFTAEALDVLARSGSTRATRDLLKTSGFDLVDQRRLESIEAALIMIGKGNEDEEALSLALRAYVCRAKSDYAESEHLFSYALALAVDPELRVNIAHRYAALLTYPNQRYVEAFAITETVTLDNISNATLRYRFIARKAAILSYMCRGPEPKRLINEAMLGTRSLDFCEPARLSVLLASVIVALNQEEYDAALATAIDISDKTERVGLLFWTGSALEFILQIIYAQGRVQACVDALEKLRMIAERTASRAHFQHYLTVAYDLAIQRGDDSTSSDIRHQLDSEIQQTSLSSSALAAVDALHAAFGGKFRKAYEIADRSKYVEASEQSLLGVARRLFYAGAAGMRPEAESELALFGEELGRREKLPSGSFVLGQAVAIAAIGSLLAGHNGTCNRFLRSIERSSHHQDVIQLATVARLLYLESETGVVHDELTLAMEGLRTSTLGGYAKALAFITVSPNKEGTTFSALTAGELRVLRLLSGGATSRQVGAETGRSSLTIDTHVKSIARKLRCSGRREAIALARAHGIV